MGFLKVVLKCGLIAFLGCCSRHEAMAASIDHSQIYQLMLLHVLDTIDPAVVVDPEFIFGCHFCSCSSEAISQSTGVFSIDHNLLASFPPLMLFNH